MPSYKHKRAPSVDMTSIGLRNASAPTPTYSSIFRSQDDSYMLHQMYEPAVKENASKRPRLSNERTGTTYAPALSPEDTFEVDEKSFPVKSEAHGASRPHATEPRPFAFNWPRLPRRSQSHSQPRGPVSIPWVLALLSCVTLLWFVSVAIGAGLFSAVYSQPASPAVQKIYLVLNDEVLNIKTAPGTLPDTVSVTVPPVSSVTAGTLSSTTTSPTTTGTSVAESISSQAPQSSAEQSQIETSKPRRRDDARPTGFVTMART
jgi:hypothetical protein